MAFWKTSNNKKREEEKQSILEKLQNREVSSDFFSELVHHYNYDILIEAIVEHCDTIAIDIIKGWASLIVAYKKQSKMEYGIQLVKSIPETHKAWILFLKILEYSKNPKLQEIIQSKIKNTFGESGLQVILALMNEKPIENAEDLLLLSLPCIEALCKKLIIASKTKEEPIREKIMILLGKTKENQDLAIKRLSFALEDPKSKICKMAASSLVCIGEKSLPTLRSVLKKGTSRTQVSVIWALGKLTEDNPDLIIEELFDYLGTPEERIRKPVLWALEHNEDRIAELLLEKVKNTHDSLYIQSVLSLWDKMPKLPESVIEYLKHYCDYPPSSIRIELLYLIAHHALPMYMHFVLHSLKEENEQLCEVAIYTLTELFLKNAIQEPPIATIIKLLVDLYAHRSSFNIRKQIFQSFAKLQYKDDKILNILVETIKNDTEELKLLALKALPYFEEQSEIALPEILNILEHIHQETMILSCLNAIEHMHTHDTKAMNIVLSFILSPVETIRYKALDTLVSMGIEITAPLLKISRNCNIQMQMEISKKLATFGKAIVSVLIENIRGNCPVARRVAADTFSNMGESAIPFLDDLMSETDFWIKKTVVSALSKMGKDAIPALIQLIRDEQDNGSVAMAIEALQKMKQKALGYLIPLLYDNNVRLSQLAIYSLKKVNATYMDSIPDLLDLIQHPHPIVRQSVAWCLGQIGHRDPAVFQALRTLQSDTDNSVAKVAEQILNQLMK